MNRTLRRGLCVLAATGALLLGAAGTAAATPGSSEPFHTSTAAPHPAADPAACPQSGQRVKTPSSPAVYLIGPDGTANWIPTVVDYQALWDDNWTGIETASDTTMWDCFTGYWTMSNVHLAKTPTRAAIYIYDVNHGGYRWITSSQIWARYGFVVANVRHPSIIRPISSQNWDH